MIRYWKLETNTFTLPISRLVNRNKKSLHKYLKRNIDMRFLSWCEPDFLFSHLFWINFSEIYSRDAIDIEILCMINWYPRNIMIFVKVFQGFSVSSDDFFKTTFIYIIKYNFIASVADRNGKVNWLHWFLIFYMFFLVFVWVMNVFSFNALVLIILF